MKQAGNFRYIFRDKHILTASNSNKHIRLLSVGIQAVFMSELVKTLTLGEKRELTLKHIRNKG